MLNMINNNPFIQKIQFIFNNLSMRTTVTLSSLTLAAIATLIAGISAFSLYDVSKTTDKNGQLVEALSGMNGVAADLGKFIYNKNPDLLVSSRAELDTLHDSLNEVAANDQSADLKDAIAQSNKMSSDIARLEAGLSPVEITTQELRTTFSEIVSFSQLASKSAQAGQRKAETIQAKQATKENAAAIVTKEIFYFFNAADIFNASLPKRYENYPADKIEESRTLLKEINEPLVRMDKSMFSLNKFLELGDMQQKVKGLSKKFDVIVESAANEAAPNYTYITELMSDLSKIRSYMNTLVHDLNEKSGTSKATNNNSELQAKITAATALIQKAGDAYSSTRIFAATPNAKNTKELDAAMLALVDATEKATKVGLDRAEALTNTYTTQLATLKTLINGQEQVIKDVVESSSSTGKLMASVASVGAAEAVSTTHSALLSIAVSIVTLVALVIGTIMAMEHMISAPVKRMASQMSKLAQGDLSIEANNSERTNEIGAMEKAIGVFHENAKARVQLESQTNEDRERERKRQTSVESLIGGFRDDVTQLLSSFNTQAGQMVDTAQSLNQVADEANQQTDSATANSKDSSSSIQTVAAAAEELSISTQEINRQVTTTSQVVEDGNRNAQETSDRVSQLATSAQKIGDVVNLIQDIAEQTNLLALNATIEAARAGESGKGFAVVAQEVKSLAAQTRNATTEIAEQIAGIQHASDEAVEAIMSINEIMSDVQSHTSSIAASVVQQNEATQEISLSAQNASNGADKTTSNMSSVSDAMQRTAGSAKTILGTSNNLTEGATTLSERIDDFLTKVAAA